MVTVPQGPRAGDRFVATIPPPRAPPSRRATARRAAASWSRCPPISQSFSAKSTSAAGRLNLISTQAAARCKVERRRDRPADGALPATREPPRRRRARRGPPPARANGRSVLLAFDGSQPASSGGARAFNSAATGRPPPRAAPRVGAARRPEEQGQARRGRPHRVEIAEAATAASTCRTSSTTTSPPEGARGDSTPSTRRRPSGRVGSMAWRLTPSTAPRVDFHTGREPAPPGPRPGRSPPAPSRPGAGRL